MTHSKRLLISSFLFALLASQVFASEPSDSPRDVLLKVVTILAEGKEEDVKDLCSKQGWKELQEALGHDERSHPEIARRELVQTHFKTLLPLKDEEIVWRFFGSNYCAAGTMQEHQNGEGF